MRRLPEVRGLPFLGTSLNILQAGGAPKLHQYIDQQHRRLGPVFRENMGTVSGVFLADPVSARAVFTAEGQHPQHLIPEAWLKYNSIRGSHRGLFFMEGEKWHKYRQIMNRLMLKKNISYENEVHKFIVDNFVEDMSQFVGRHISHLEHHFYKHSITYLVGTLMGSAYFDRGRTLSREIDTLASIVSEIFSTTSRLMNVPVSLAASLGLPVWNQFVAAVDASVIAGRQLVDKICTGELPDGLLRDLLNEDLSPQVLTDIIIDLMLAAGDTTAYTSQWALYLLAGASDVAEKVRNDKSQQLVAAVVRETLRLYPAAIFISRRIKKNLDLNNLGYTIPAGELVMLSLYTLGRLEDAFPEPHRFWPERWERSSSDNSDGRAVHRGVLQPAAFLPFALGARSCIGRRLAEAQLALTISKMVLKWHLQLNEIVEMELRMVPVPSKPIRIMIEPIKSV